MDLDAQLLLITIFLPLAGAGVLLLVGEAGQRFARQVALWTSLATLALAAILVARYQPSPQSHVLGASSFPWLGESFGLNITCSFGLDGLSLWLFGLSALLVVTSVLVSWEAINQRPALFYGLLLVLESGMLGVFSARDIILFYVFFEFTLIPLFLLIGIWGSEERRYAAIKFFLFTLAGSVLTLLGLIAIVILNARQTGSTLTFSIPELTQNLSRNPLDERAQLLIFLALFAGFAVKVPLFPLHTWLPLAHVQAPTAGSVILAGVLLKIGGYGFARFSLPMLPDASAYFAPWLLGLSVAGIIYGALVALAQSDIKRLIAYSSVSHLGYCMLGLFALTRPALQGGVLQMVNHGLATGGLFALVGMLYERYHTRQIADLGGLAWRTPRWTLMMLVFALASIGLPGLGGFAGEFLVLLGTFQRSQVEATIPYWSISALAVFGVVLGAWYMLWLVERVCFGPLKEPSRHGDDPPVRDLSMREVLALAPLAAMLLWIGLAPGFFTARMRDTLVPLTSVATEAFDERTASRPANPRAADRKLASETPRAQSHH